MNIQENTELFKKKKKKKNFGFIPNDKLGKLYAGVFQ